MIRCLGYLSEAPNIDSRYRDSSSFSLRSWLPRFSCMWRLRRARTMFLSPPLKRNLLSESPWNIALRASDSSINRLSSSGLIMISDLPAELTARGTTSSRSSRFTRSCNTVEKGSKPVNRLQISSCVGDPMRWIAVRMRTSESDSLDTS